MANADWGLCALADSCSSCDCTNTIKSVRRKENEIAGCVRDWAFSACSVWCETGVAWFALRGPLPVPFGVDFPAVVSRSSNSRKRQTHACRFSLSRGVQKSSGCRAVCCAQCAKCVRVFAPEDAACGKKHLGNFPKDFSGENSAKGFSLSFAAFIVRVCVCVVEIAFANLFNRFITAVHNR